MPGSTSGIGEASAIALAARGAHVLVVGRNAGRTEPEELAAAIVFLAGDVAGFIHGVTLAVDGVRTAV